MLHAILHGGIPWEPSLLALKCPGATGTPSTLDAHNFWLPSPNGAFLVWLEASCLDLSNHVWHLLIVFEPRALLLFVRSGVLITPYLVSCKAWEFTPKVLLAH